MFGRLSDIGRKIYHILESAIRSGVERTRIFEVARMAEPLYKAEDFINDFKTLSQAVARWAEAEYWEMDIPLPADAFEPVRVHVPEPYLVTVKGRLINVKTGEETAVHYTLSFDHIPSRKEIMKKAFEAFNERLRTGETDWQFKYEGIDRLMFGLFRA